MTKISLKTAFLLATIFLLLSPVLLPQIRLWPFSPFLALLFHRATLIQSLWGSFLCGLMLDLFSTQFSFGLFSTIHVLGTLFLYSQRKHFFEDKPLAFCLYSVLISFCLSLLLFFIDRQIPLKGKTMLSDFLVLPCVEGLYAFSWFILPSMLYSFCKKQWVKTFKTGQE